MVTVTKEVNPHFDDFLFDWNQKFYFLVGGYGSSKSYHVAMKLIMKLISEKRTALVVREVYDTHRDSTFSLLEEIVNDMGLADRVRCLTSPMQVRFPNGSKIIFKGMDKTEKLKSINNISLIWIEECSEVKYAGFKELLGRLRHPTLPLHMILSTNPVGENNWSFKHFFKDIRKKITILDDQQLYEQRTIVKGDTYYHHSTADDNLFLPDSYVEQLDELEKFDPDLYRIARKGQFGVNGVRVFPQFEVQSHEDVLKQMERVRHKLQRTGMDFGFETSYNALVRMLVDKEQQILYIFGEYYKNKQTDDVTAKDLEHLKREVIRGDAAEPKTIAFFKKNGFRMQPGKKFAGSRLQYTKKVKRFKKIICSDACPNTIFELEDLTFKVDKKGDIIEDDFSIDPHTLSAIWYGLDDYEVADLKGDAILSNRNAW